MEAGSGLVVLDPVDVSGGYTSVKDKTNISLVSTDIHAHLSLSVISLLLNLKSQASTALQFGNADPLSPCTNFDRIWVSPKGVCCLPMSFIFYLFVFLCMCLVSIISPSNAMEKENRKHQKTCFSSFCRSLTIHNLLYFFCSQRMGVLAI